MVEYMKSENKSDSVWQWPEPETSSLAGEKHPMKLEEVEEDGPLHKRWKASSSPPTSQWSIDSNEFPVPPSQYNPLSEPSPLGLRLKKSPSLLELIQMRLSQGKTDYSALHSEDHQVGNKKDVKPRVGASGSIDKLKASNFPALLLRIGQWEYLSKHEGDLVAKCYFAKHKLVWEVLDGGLKNKIEIQWSDIVALKASCPDDGPGSLTIVLGKPPQFYRETNPQPRKHTLWQATSDFTNGEASVQRQHYLQCAQGVLNKHYEKLIQCDTRLNFLSQQPVTVLDVPFAAEASIMNPDATGSKGSSVSVSGILDVASPSTTQPLSSKTEELDATGLVHGDLTTNAHLTGSVIPLHAFEEHGPKNTRLQPNMSISDLVNHIGHCISEQKSIANLPSGGGDSQKDMLEDIAQVLLSDTQFTTASDEKTLMSRVNSLCCLLQDSNSDGGGKAPQHVGNDNSNPDRNENGLGMSRKDSFTDLLHQLPRIASLPKFLFDISEDGEILNP